jgi:hypothetical protein
MALSRTVSGPLADAVLPRQATLACRRKTYIYMYIYASHSELGGPQGFLAINGWRLAR